MKDYEIIRPLIEVSKNEIILYNKKIQKIFTKPQRGAASCCSMAWISALLWGSTELP